MQLVDLVLSHLSTCFKDSDAASGSVAMEKIINLVNNYSQILLSTAVNLKHGISWSTIVKDVLSHMNPEGE